MPLNCLLNNSLIKYVSKKSDWKYLTGHLVTMLVRNKELGTFKMRSTRKVRTGKYKEYNNQP